jgi:hypothetical protein
MKEGMFKSNQTARLIIQLVRDFGLSVSQAAAVAMVPVETVKLVLTQANFAW